MKTGLDRARHEFKLHNPVGAIDKDWDAYTRGRLATAKKCLSVLNVKNHDNASDDDYDSDMGESTVVYATSEAVQDLEEPFGMEKGALVDAVHMLNCYAEFYDDSPRTVKVLSRIHSLSTPCSIDVHFAYYSRERSYEVEWSYAIAYRINRHPDLTPMTVREVLKGLSGASSHLPTLHSQQGWNSIAWGLYDDSDDNYGERWKRILVKDSGLNKEGVMEVYEALFGALPSPDTNSACGEDAVAKQEQENRETLVLTVQLLLASVGVEYGIAVQNDEDDVDPELYGPIDWDLNGYGKWFPREVRRACGIALPRDAIEEAQEKRDYEEELEDDEDDEDSDEGGFDDDGDGGYSW